MTYSEACEKGSDFMRFWDAYPRRPGGNKGGRLPAYEAWRRCGDDLPPIDDLLAALELFKASKSWSEGYIPDCRKWLRNRQWEDPPTTESDAAAAQRHQYRARGDSMTADETRRYLQQLRQGG